MDRTKLYALIVATGVIVGPVLLLLALWFVPWLDLSWIAGTFRGTSSLAPGWGTVGLLFIAIAVSDLIAYAAVIGWDRQVATDHILQKAMIRTVVPWFFLYGINFPVLILLGMTVPAVIPDPVLSVLVQMAIDAAIIFVAWKVLDYALARHFDLDTSFWTGRTLACSPERRELS